MIKKIIALSLLAACFDLHAAGTVANLPFPTGCHATYPSQLTLNSGGTSATVTCDNTTPPTPVIVGCTKPPVLASSTPGITNYTMLNTNISASYFGAGTKTSMNPTQFTSMFDAPGITKDWPGVRGVGVYFTVPTNKYISTTFIVPANYLSSQATNVYGFYSVNEQQNQAPISMTISTSCGDFSPSTMAGSTVVPGCTFNKANPDEGLFWRANSNCVLKPSGQYYLNLINADISALTPNGGGTAASTKTALPTQFHCSTYSCQMSIVNGPGNWIN